MAFFRIAMISVVAFLLLERTALPQAMNGTYAGQVKSQSPGGCFTGETAATVTINGTSVTGNWMGGVAPNTFAGEMSGTGFLIRLITPRGEPTSVQGNVAGTALTARILGASGCQFWGILQRK
jgi:hypothetical protein